MKSLIIYYSYEGNSEKIAEAIQEVTNADVISLKSVKENKTKSLYKFIWGAQQVYMSKTPEIENVDVDFSKYDIIFIGTPCWFGTYAPPLNTFLKDYQLIDKKVAIYTCSGGHLKNTYPNLKEALKRNTIVNTIDFVYPIKKGIDKAQKQAQKWATECINNKKIAI